MKVLVVTNNLEHKSGWGRYSIDLIEKLLKNNIKVVVLCHQRNNKLESIQQIETLPDPISFKRGYLLSFFYTIKSINKLKRKNDFDLIHCLVEPYAFITYLLARFLKIKYFITIHGSFGVKAFANKFYKILQLLAYKNASKNICISNYTKQRILKYKKLNNIVIIPNGVNKETFSSQENNLEKGNIIVSVGALKLRKGFDVTIKALSIVKKKFADIKYYIIGDQQDPKYTNQTKKLIKELDLEKNIILLDNITDQELVEIYKQAKIFVLTPLSDKYNFEGFGLVYLEANAFGLPVIGSYDNGGEDAIANGVTGFLTKPKDEKDIAEKIELLLSDQAIYNNIARNAMAWAEKLSWENIIKIYIGVYQGQLS